MTSTLESQFSSLSLNSSEANSINRLPLEIIKLIFLCPILSNKDVFRCLVVCTRWSPMAKEALYQHVEIGRYTDIPNLLYYLKQSSDPRCVRSLTFEHVPNKRVRPLRYGLDSLMPECHNLEVITIKASNPFYILISVYLRQFPKLKEVDLLWDTCNHSRTVLKWFYTVNYSHRATITSITMPYIMFNDIELYGDNGDNGELMIMTKESFLDSFMNLKYVSYISLE